VVPSIVPQLMTSGNAEGAKRVMNAFMKMKKLDLATIQRAYDGVGA
jgi:predicted 3-demethylubiquinone-9 3-methyltransferase (glyoxalase superfamily)